MIELCHEATLNDTCRRLSCPAVGWRACVDHLFLASGATDWSVVSLLVNSVYVVPSGLLSVCHDRLVIDSRKIFQCAFSISSGSVLILSSGLVRRPTLPQPQVGC